MQREFGRGILFFLCLLWLPAIGAAQSQITGQVKDESGAVMPGVSVEAASPVLIEKLRTVVTDDQGRYTIVDLRPGTYKVTFSLVGFSTIVRDAVELPGNFTATVNADLKVGSLEETVTVSGATPTVDVQQASRAVVLTRDIIDALPTTRNIMAVGMLVPGVRLGTQDVGGSNALSQSSPRVHGVGQTESVQMVDGMSIQTSEDCVCQVYQDEAIAAEVTVTTSAIPAEVAAGGMRTNSIPKDGGNSISGAVFVGGTNGTWQSDNVDDYLRSLNIRKADGISHIQNFNASMGGPLVKDTLWYFMAARHLAVDKFPANVDQEYIVAPDGEVIRAVNDQLTRNATLRLTWQITDKLKFAPMVQRLWKEVGNSFVFGQDPRVGQQRDPTKANNFFGTAKLSYAANSKLFLEGGFASTYQNMTQQPQVGTGGSFIEDRNNPLFYTRVEKADTTLNINPDCPYLVRLHQLGLQQCRAHAGRRPNLVGVGDVCDRQPQLQGWVPVQDGPGRCAQPAQWRSDRELREQPAEHSDRLQHARQPEGRHQCRFRNLCSGFLDVQTVDTESRPARPVVQCVGDRSEHARRALCAGPVL